MSDLQTREQMLNALGIVERLKKERDRHVAGYPAPRRDVAELLDQAIDALSEAEKREREARAKVLEEAAKVADEMPVLMMTSPVHVKAASPQDVARRIRALQSEER